METIHECISLHVGQAGVQMGAACWQLYCMEQGITGSGAINENVPNATPHASFFQETSDGRYVPRAVFMDLDPASIDKLLTGASSGFIGHDQTLAGQEDASGVYARGYYTVGKDRLNAAADLVRRQVEAAGSPRGFLVQRAAGGGSGGGFGSLLVERLTDDFPRLPFIEAAVLPAPDMSPYILEPYNIVLSTHTGLEYTNTASVFLLENTPVYNICKNKLDIERPCYADLNDVMAHIHSAITASLRYPEDRLLSYDISTTCSTTSTNTTITSTTSDQVNMTPLPRIHFPLVSHVPWVSREKGHHGSDQLSLQELTEELFNSENQMAQCEVTEDSRCIAYSVLFRGSTISTSDINLCTERLRARMHNSASWCPGGNKTSVHSHPLVSLPSSALADTLQSATLIANTTAVGDIWRRLGHQFDLLFSKRAFLHWYNEEGMDASEFIEARENLTELEQDYQEVAALAMEQCVPNIDGGNQKS